MKAAIYTRISSDREGRELGVTRQLEDCQAHATRLDLEIHRVYTDNDISASGKSRKVRPEYQAMLADARAGLFDVIVVYTSARLTRQPRENEDQIDLAVSHGIRYEYLRSPRYDLNTADGRKMARYAAADDAAEVDRTSERTQRDVQRRAEGGQFHGGAAPFGQEVITGQVGNRIKVVGFKLHPAHSLWVKEAADRVLAGESVYGICVDWNAKGRLSGESKPWHPRTLKRVLTTPALIGKREHDGLMHPAPWQGILDERTYERLVTLLNDPARKTSTSNKRKYALSGLLYCALCGNRLTSATTKKDQAASFECSKLKTGRGGCGKIKIVMEPLEAYITEQVFLALDTPDLHKAMAGDKTEADETERALRQAVTDDEEALQRLEDEKDDGHLPDDSYRRRRGRITTRLEANRRELLMATRATVHANLPTGDELRAVWSTKDNVWRRTILASVIERIDVGPHPRGVSSAPPRRSGEPLTAWRERFDTARALTFAQRTTVTWWH